MDLFSLIPTDMLWRSAVAVIPVAAVVAVACRLLPCRPATRHMLWFVVLLGLAMPPFVWDAPRPKLVPLFKNAVTAFWPDDAKIEDADCDEISKAPFEDNCHVVAESAAEVDDTWNGPTPAVLGRVEPDIETLEESIAEAIPNSPNIDPQPGWPMTPMPEPIDHELSAAHPVEPELERLAQAAERGGRRFFDEQLEENPSNEHLNTSSAGPIDDRSYSVARSDALDSLDETKPEIALQCYYGSPRPLPNGRGTDLQLHNNSSIEPTLPAAVEMRSDDPGIAAADEEAPSRRTDSGNVNQEETYGAGENSLVASVLDRWSTAARSIRDAIMSVPPLPVEIWVGGGITVLLLYGFQILRFRLLVRRSGNVPSEVSQLARRVAKELSLRAVPQIRFVSARISPMVWCGRHTRLLLPRQLWEELDDVGRRAVLCHELAHVRRRDHWVRRLELLAACLYWWHPVLWWIRARLHEEADTCCDAWVTWLMPRDRRAYAEALLRAKQFVSTGGMASTAVSMGMATGRAKRFSRRLTMVMTQRVRPGLSISGLALVLAVASVGWLSTPAQSCPKDDEKAAHDARRAAEAAAVLAGAPMPPAPAVAPCPPCPPAAAAAPCPPTPPVPGLMGIHAVPCPDADSGKTSFETHVQGKHAKHAKTPKPGKGPTAQRARCERCGSKKCCGGLSGGAGCAVAPVLQPGTPVALLTTGGVGCGPGCTPTGKKCCDKCPGCCGTAIAIPRSPLPPGFSENLEQRMKELEVRLSELGARLEEGGQHLEHMGRDIEARVRAQVEGAQQRVRASTERAQDRARRAVERRMRHAPQAQRREALEREDGATIVRTYQLPEGKLEALTDLMARSDVPVQIRKTDGGIEVQGTRQQHRVFAAFVHMIHPEGGPGADAGDSDFDFDFAFDFDFSDDVDDDEADDDDEDSEDDDADDDDDDDEEPENKRDTNAGPRQGGNFAQQALMALTEAYWQNREHPEALSAEAADWYRKAAEEFSQNAAEQQNIRALATQSSNQSQHAVAVSLRSQAEALTKQAEAMERSAERVEEHVRRIEEQLSELEQKEASVREAADNLTDGAREAVIAEADALRQRGEELRGQIETLQEQADRAREQADSFRTGADSVRAALDDLDIAR